MSEDEEKSRTKEATILTVLDVAYSGVRMRCEESLRATEVKMVELRSLCDSYTSQLEALKQREEKVAAREHAVMNIREQLSAARVMKTAAEEREAVLASKLQTVRKELNTERDGRRKLEIAMSELLRAQSQLPTHAPDQREPTEDEVE